ncbi:MAG: helix-turn-helix domain-containing protein [Eubacteriales bacterium]|nr:helix-turn-helix domain-containing protein [Eubacteriales bacterium]
MKRELQEISYDCPIEATIGLIGGKWKALILDHLTDGALRFGELQKRMPKITPKMLTQQLRELEEDGLITRRVFPVVPPKVEYELTEFGQTVLPILTAMCDWGRSYLDRHANME